MNKTRFKTKEGLIIMRKIKKIFLIVLCVIFTAQMTVLTGASEIISDDEVNFVTSELELMRQLKYLSYEELVDLGYSSEEIENIEHVVYMQFAEAIFERAQKSEAELRDLGHSDEQIAIFKSDSFKDITNIYNYLSSDIVDIEPLIFASVTGTISMVSASTASITARFDWEWSSAPFFRGTDMIAVRWQGSDSAGRPLNVAYCSTQSRHWAFYYVGNDFIGMGRNPGATVYPYESAQVTFHMTMWSPNHIRNGWARRGYYQVRVNRVGTAAINEVAFVFAYGHSTLGITPGASFSGLSISFNFGVSREFHGAVRIRSNGTLIPV